jgi:hypothetical protein
MHDNVDIPPARLLDAVDALLLGLTELGPAHAGRLPSSILGTLDQPLAWCDFTRAEIIAAERFLIRCGLLPASAAQRGGFDGERGVA